MGGGGGIGSRGSGAWVVWGFTWPALCGGVSPYGLCLPGNGISHTSREVRAAALGWHGMAWHGLTRRWQQRQGEKGGRGASDNQGLPAYTDTSAEETPSVWRGLGLCLLPVFPSSQKRASPPLKQHEMLSFTIHVYMNIQVLLQKSVLSCATFGHNTIILTETLGVYNVGLYICEFIDLCHTFPYLYLTLTFIPGSHNLISIYVSKLCLKA